MEFFEDLQDTSESSVDNTNVVNVLKSHRFSYGENIDYVEASPPDVEFVSLEVVEIVDPEDSWTRIIIPLHLSEVVIKFYSTISYFFLEETNTFDNSIPESETFRFNLEEISSGSPTTRSDLSLPDYKAFYVDNDHFKEKRDLYHEEFADELTHIMSLPNLECFKFKIDPDPGDLDSIDLGIRKNDFPDCEDSRACSIHKSFTSSASFWKSSIQI
ncbi:hypothetical protein Tco_0468462 [Tanacetum coccineum]